MKSKRSVLIIVAVLFILFVVRGILLLDPDFGWHLRMGELISTNGIPKTDPFSFTMPSYPFVNHEWLVDLFTYEVFPLFNFPGLSLVYTMIFFLTIYIIALPIFKNNKNKKNKEAVFLKTLLVFLSFGVFIPYFGIRPQVLSWFFLAIVLRLMFNNRLWQKWRFFLPILFIIWTNLHASFSLGIAVLLIYFGFKFFRTKKLEIKDALILVFTILATFLTPYGGRVWWEVFMTMTDSSLHWTIMEWRPAFSTFHTSYLIFLTISLVFIFRYRKKYFLEEKALFLFFLFESISALRHIPLWTILTLFLLFKATDYFTEEVAAIKDGTSRLRKTGNILFIAFLTILIFDFGLTIYDASKVRENGFYPNEAVNYLKNKDYKGNMFSYYGWGGYLIWKLPDKKVFIDGRMPSWRWRGKQGESDYAMGEYLAVYQGKAKPNQIFDKYSIQVVLWPKEREKTVLDLFSKNIKDFVYKSFSKSPEEYNLLEEIEKEGWQKAYEDEVAAVYIRD